MSVVKALRASLLAEVSGSGARSRPSGVVFVDVSGSRARSSHLRLCSLTSPGRGRCAPRRQSLLRSFLAPSLLPAATPRLGLRPMRTGPLVLERAVGRCCLCADGYAKWSAASKKPGTPFTHVYLRVSSVRGEGSDRVGRSPMRGVAAGRSDAARNERRSDWRRGAAAS